MLLFSYFCLLKNMLQENHKLFSEIENYFADYSSIVALFFDITRFFDSNNFPYPNIKLMKLIPNKRLFLNSALVRT